MTEPSPPTSMPPPSGGGLDARLADRIQASEHLILVALDAEGRILRFNRGAELATGYAAEEVLGRGWFETLAPADTFPEVQAEFQRLVAGGAPRRFQNPLITKAGETRVFSWSNEPLLEGGRLEGFLSLGQDITDQVRAEQARSRQAEVLERIFDSTQLCIVYLDPDFTFIRVNEAYARVCARPRDSFPGLNHFDLYPHAENEAIFRRVVETGEPFTIYAKPFEFPDHPEWGVTYWDWTLQPLKDAGGRVEGLLFLLLDVTERRRMEEHLLQLQRMEALGRLAGGVAHDFNNLLTAILGFAEIGSLKSQDRPELHDAFRGIEDTAERASHLTRQLLAFARRQPSEPRPVDLNALTQGMQKLLRRFIGGGVDLALLLEPALWRVQADPGQLEQVLMNLAVNARDAMHGGGTLTVSTANRTLGPEAAALELAPGDYAAWAVADTGDGIPPELLTRIFEPFFTTKPPEQGTGLGLATCHGIVRQHGGAIQVESRPGQGTRFTVFLPRTGEALSDFDPSAADLPRGRETVLVVEDHPLVRQMTARMLEDLGYRPLEALHGDEALLRSREAEELDLAVVDLLLPVRGGEDTALRLREARPGLKVLFVSGYSETLPAAVKTRAPWAAFLEKPYTPAQLARAVRALLDAPA